MSDDTLTAEELVERLLYTVEIRTRHHANVNDPIAKESREAADMLKAQAAEIERLRGDNAALCDEMARIAVASGRSVEDGKDVDWFELSGDVRDVMSRATAAEAKVAALTEALELAQKWLANCVPVTPIDLPHPLPVIAAALGAKL